jgi:hypothetical protein
MTVRGDVLAGRYRVVSPLPPVGGVPRDLAVDTVAGGQVEVARYARRGAVPSAFSASAGRFQAVRHPCLVPIVAWTEPGDDPVVDPIIVEQHVEGARLGAGITLPRRSSLLVAADTADALAALHAADLAHGALLPDAVVLDKSGRAILIGAGTNRLQADALGTEPPADEPQTDLRALGALLYTLVCGRPPAQPAAPPVEIVPDLEPALNGLILALLSDDPQRPPPPAPAVSLRLRELAGEPPVEMPRAVPVPPPSRHGPLPAAGFALLAGAAIIAILGVVAAFAVTRGKTETTATKTVTMVSTTVITRAGGPPIISAVPASTVTITAGGAGTLTGTVTATATLAESVLVTDVLVTKTVTSTGVYTITKPLTHTIPGGYATVTTPVTLYGF